jgi:hypothetical protein
MFRYKLRTLLIVLAFASPLLGCGCSPKQPAVQDPKTKISRIDLLSGIDPSPQLLDGDWEPQEGSPHFKLSFAAGVWPDAVDDLIATVQFDDATGSGFMRLNIILDHPSKELLFYPPYATAPSTYSSKDMPSRGKGKVITETTLEVEANFENPGKKLLLSGVFVKRTSPPNTEKPRH